MCLVAQARVCGHAHTLGTSLFQCSQADYGPGALLHEVATELLDALLDEPGGCATSEKMSPDITMKLLAAAGGAETAHRLLQCVRAAEKDAVKEHGQQQLQQQSDSSEPATAAVLQAMAGGLERQGHVAMEALLHAQPSLVLLRLCLRAYTCLQLQ